MSNYLDGNTFLISNKTYSHASIAQWGTAHGRSIGAYDGELNLDRFWRLEEDRNHPGYYTINNVHYEGYRIVKWGSGDDHTGVGPSNHYDDQLWKFVDEGNGYYRIFNCWYPKAKIAKWGERYNDWGTYELQNYDDQLWRLTPRYKANIRELTIFSSDRLPISFSQTSTVTTGIRLTNSSSLSTKVGLEVSLKQAVSMEVNGKASHPVELIQKLLSEISKIISSNEEKSWFVTKNITFTPPANKNFRVRQLTIRFDSPLTQDNLEMRCECRIEESDGDFLD